MEDVKGQLPRRNDKNLITVSCYMVVPPEAMRSIMCDITQEYRNNNKGYILVGSAPYEDYPIEPELLSGVYKRRKDNTSVNRIIGNPATTHRTIKKSQVLGVFEPIEQEELEDFLPTKRKTDVKVDIVNKKELLNQEIPLTPEEVFEKSKFPQDLHKPTLNRLRHLITSNPDAFTRYKSDVGNFIGFYYELRLLESFTVCIFRR